MSTIPSSTWSRPSLTHPAAGHRDTRDHHREPGRDLGRLLGHAAGHSARLHAADAASRTPRRCARGQIYLPTINWALAAMVALLVVSFRSSAAMLPAYGLAVVGTMLITTLMQYVVVFRIWKRPLWQGGDRLCGIRDHRRHLPRVGTDQAVRRCLVPDPGRTRHLHPADDLGQRAAGSCASGSRKPRCRCRCSSSRRRLRCIGSAVRRSSCRPRRTRCQRRCCTI